MKRIKCTVSYDGTNFQGFQVQPEGRTVQGEIEHVLKKMHKGENIRIHASGRTDRGVHAKGQVFHFDTPLSLTEEQWKRALNSQLPQDIVIRSTEFVSEDFHARFSCVAKEYRYIILYQEERDPFLVNYTHHHPYPLDLQKIEEAMKYFLGTHDFTSFSSAKTEIHDRVRTIDLFKLQRENNKLIFRIRGDGFLYNMVRIIVGTLLDVGSGKIEPEKIPEIFAAKDRTRAGKTISPNGLYLWKVYY